MKPNCIVVDLDGTVTNNSHRLYLVEGENKDYEKYNSLSFLDTPRIGIIQKILAYGLPIVIVSGREKGNGGEYFTSTKQWLFNNNISPIEIYMSSSFDRTPAVPFKYSIIQDVMKKYNVVTTFDDDKEVREMYRSLGIKTEYVKPLGV